MSRITREKENSLFLFLAPRKERILPRIWNSECAYGKWGGKSSFQAYLLNKIRLDPVPSSEGGDEIIPKSHRSPAKAHQSSPLRPPPRRGKRERWRMGNPRSWSPHFFPFSSFPLFLSPVNLTRTISSSFPRPECSLSEAIVARPRRGREGYMFYRRNSS